MPDYEKPAGKDNIFAHIFYEFRMYIDTYNAFGYLEETINRIKVDDGFKTPFLDYTFFNNILIESHATHLRNLIYFFTSKKGNINLSTVFVTIPQIGISDPHDKMSKLISQALSHLTEDRYKSTYAIKGVEKDLPEALIDLINEMHPVIYGKITDYVRILSNGDTVKDEFKEMLLCYRPKIEAFKRDYSYL